MRQMKQIGLRVPPGMLELIDERRGSTAREVWIREAILDRLEGDDALDRALEVQRKEFLVLALATRKLFSTLLDPASLEPAEGLQKTAALLDEIIRNRAR